MKAMFSDENQSITKISKYLKFEENYHYTGK